MILFHRHEQGIRITRMLSSTEVTAHKLEVTVWLPRSVV